MTDSINKANQNQLQEAQQLLVIVSLPPETRLECEGVVALGFESQVVGLIEQLQQLISEKEAAYQEYKKTIKDALLSAQPKA